MLRSGFRLFSEWEGIDDLKLIQMGKAALQAVYDGALSMLTGSPGASGVDVAGSETMAPTTQHRVKRVYTRRTSEGRRPAPRAAARAAGLLACETTREKPIWLMSYSGVLTTP